MRSFPGTATRFEGRAALFEAAGEDSYTRMLSAPEPIGYRNAGATVWFAPLPWMPGKTAISVRGETSAAVDLVSQLLAANVLEPGNWLRMPRMKPGDFGTTSAHHLEDWNVYATQHAPTPHPGEHRVVELPASASDEIAAILAEGADGEPDAQAPGIRRWYGIYAHDALVACGADRSWNGIGYLARITVAGSHRGQGLGTALTTYMTRTLHSESGVVGLGVTSKNDAAQRLYYQLGFREVAAISTFELARNF